MADPDDMATDPTDLLRRLHRDTRIPDPALVQQINKGTFTADAVGHADITDVLLTHDPLWKWEPLALDESGLPKITVDKSGRLAMWGELYMFGHSHGPEVGTCLATSPDPLKELVGDFLRRGAMRFGVALALWSKSQWSEAGDAGSQSGGRSQTDIRGSARKENAPRTGNVTQLPTPSDDDVARHPAAGGEPRLPRDQAIAMRADELGLSEEERQEAIWVVTNHRTRSGKDLRAGEGSLVFAQLDAMAKAKSGA